MTEFSASSRLLVMALILLALAGCASTEAAKSNGDPYENVNRKVYSFNDKLDKNFFEPVAKKYAQYTPSPVRSGITNFFDNTGYLNTIANDLLQGKISQTAHDSGRFLVNSTIGIGGLFDPATSMGLKQNSEDLGQTFGKWGMPTGPYLVIPFIGVSNLRDGIGNAIYSSLDPVWASHVPTRNVAFSLRMVSRRAGSLDASAAIDDAALDKYQFVRDAYLQRRRSMVDDDLNRAGRK